jgi:hypothetical protein
MEVNNRSGQDGVGRGEGAGLGGAEDVGMGVAGDVSLEGSGPAVEGFAE